MATNSFTNMFSPTVVSKKQNLGDPKIIKYGKEVDVKTWLNENNIDCEIYETLEKYGSLPNIKPDLVQIVGDMEKMDLRKALDRQIIADNLWTSLPLDIRKEFKHDKNEFMEKGIDWMKNKIAIEEQKKLDAIANNPELKTTTAGGN